MSSPCYLLQDLVEPNTHENRRIESVVQ
jgi:hypothetical protein